MSNIEKHKYAIINIQTARFLLLRQTSIIETPTTGKENGSEK